MPYNTNHHHHNHSGSSTSAPPPAPTPSLEPGGGEEEKDMYYLPYDHEYWEDKEDGAKDVEDVLSLPEDGATAGNGTGSEAEAFLQEANRELVRSLVPVLVLLALLLLLTLAGNALVCLVYRTRFRRNTVNLLVVFLAALEMVTVGVGVPLEMAVVALPLTFGSPAACKVARYVETASVCVVLLVLTGVAVDRYVKTSRPTNSLSQRRVKGLCLGSVLAGLALALPSLFVFGARAVPTERDGVQGVACGVDDAARSSPARFAYVGLLLLTFAGAVGVKAVLYVLMFVRLCRRKSAAATRGEKVSPARREYPRKHRFVTEDSVSSCGGGGGGGGGRGGGGGEEETRRLPTASSSSSSGGMGMAASVRSGRSSPGVDPARVPLKSGVKESARIGQGAGTTVDVQSNRMTWIFFLASVVTLLTLLPFVALRTLLVVTGLLDHLQPLAVHVVYQLCVRLYLLHAPLIPLVYLCCNHNLRREARHLLGQCGGGGCCCLPCKRHPPTSNGSASAGDAHR